MSTLIKSKLSECAVNITFCRNTTAVSGGLSRAEIKSTDFGDRIVRQSNYNSLINKILAIVDAAA